MKLNNIKRTLAVVASVAALSFTSCVGDLDTTPIDPNTISGADVFDDPSNYTKALAKLYSGYVVTGQVGPAGDADIGGIDEGASQYIRRYWELQQFPTDETINGWADGNLPKLSYMSWGSNNEFISALYSRIFYQISICNEFIRNTKDTDIVVDGLSTKEMYNEARFLRAYSYWHALDLFGNGIPFTTEADGVGKFLPNPAGKLNGPELFNYISSELRAVEADLSAPAPGAETGRANQAAAWMLLSRLYLNAESYGQPAKYDSALLYTNKVLNSGYALVTNNQGSTYSAYQTLFLADNNTSGSEIIWSHNENGLRSKSYGGSAYLIHASIGGTMDATEFGVNGGWGGNRSMKTLTQTLQYKSVDDRNLVHTDGQKEEINDPTQFTEGYAIAKFRNKTRAGAQGSDPTGDFVDTDFIVFRLAEAYLNYAELAARGVAGASQSQALNYVNALYTRANVPVAEHLKASEVNVEQIIKYERSRELYWEGLRRTDLIRLGQFTGGAYVWQFKGGVKDGASTSSIYNVCPIPSSDLGANPNLVQNPGY
ncbi:RagB/SusD family nutrient uptake outer membrane protein [Flammeovirga pectinis]|uniref:RagB/SusD family nutrient uptake outer membrane protein n=1 Tax=Flammeovirga pectinis TaxID=2494373 RepID=A0A3S9P0G3_9BACT|nr:RagB/SusD family nutrient uptake outer membrane protein [Flammeovirga pectinis]AZQ61675.1 RagB/SusD family nutrient uptake outer membrane protein [Flammeovirga pectinis]